jgi:hypothetical protein
MAEQDKPRRVFRAGPDETSIDEPADDGFDGDAGQTRIAEHVLPEMTFSMHVLSLNTLALLHLGLLDEAEGAPVDLPAARHAIDTIEMLRKKTEGNLTAEESRMLDSLLYDLRMKYVAAK